MNDAQLVSAADTALDLAHEVSKDGKYYDDWYLDPEGSSGYRYQYFEMCVSPSFKGGVEYLAKVYDREDCSCCPIPVFAVGRGASRQEAMDNLMADLRTHIPSHSVGDEWKPTIGDLLAS